MGCIQSGEKNANESSRRKVSAVPPQHGRAKEEKEEPASPFSAVNFKKVMMPPKPRLSVKITAARTKHKLTKWDGGKDSMKKRTGTIKCEREYELFLEMSNLFCEDLTFEELLAIKPFFKRIEFDKGSMVFKEGKTSDKMFFLVKGDAVVTAKDDRGFIVELLSLYPGDCLGEANVLGKQRLNPFTTSTMSRCVFYTLDHKTLKELLKNAPASGPAKILLERAQQRAAIENFVPNIQPLDGMSKKRSFRILQLFDVVSYKAGSEIFRTGDSDSRFCIVASGQANVLDRQGKLLRKLKPHDYFGEVSLVTNRPHSATVRVDDQGDCVLLELAREDFLSLFAQEESVLSEFAIRVMGINSELHNILHHNRARKLFSEFIEQEYAKENIDFWLAVESLESMERSKTRRGVLKSVGINPDSVKIQKEDIIQSMCCDIFSTYVSPKLSKAPVNVSSTVVRNIQAEIDAQKYDIDMFAEAKEEVYNLMSEDTFTRFLASEKFQLLLKEVNAYELNYAQLIMPLRRKSKSSLASALSE